MKEINLLPWRQERQTIENKIFFFLAGVLAIIVFLLFNLIGIYLKFTMQKQEKELKILQTEISSLEGKITEIKGLQDKQNLLLSRREIIQALQESRSLIVVLLQDIAAAVPDNLLLSSLQRKEKILYIEGNSINNAQVATFMSNLQKFSWVASTSLQEIKTNNVKNKYINDKWINFSLQIDLKIASI